MGFCPLRGGVRSGWTSHPGWRSHWSLCPGLVAVALPGRRVAFCVRRRYFRAVNLASEWIFNVAFLAFPFILRRIFYPFASFFFALLPHFSGWDSPFSGWDSPFFGFVQRIFSLERANAPLFYPTQHPQNGVSKGFFDPNEGHFWPNADLFFVIFGHFLSLFGHFSPSLNWQNCSRQRCSLRPNAPYV